MITMHHVVWALLNSIWQSAALAALVFLSLKAVPRSTAAQRYAIWCAVLAATALLPFANFVLARVTQPRQVNLRVPSFTIPAAHVDPIGSSHKFFASSQYVVQPTKVAHNNAVPSSTPLDETPPSFGLAPTVISVMRGRYDLALVLAWLAVTNLLILRLAFGYASLSAVKKALSYRSLSEREREACRALTTRPVAIGYSATIREPCVIGFAKPVIALPLSVALQFSTQDADRIIRHECAHIGRFDDYGNLLKQLMLTVLCFNPVAFALAKALDLEREIACDDAAASAQTERADFARCLCHIALLQNGRRWLPSTGLAKNKRQLFVRIGRLLDRNHAASTHLNPLARIAVAAVVLAALPFACVQFLASDAATAASNTTVATGSAASTTTALPAHSHLQSHAAVVAGRKVRPRAWQGAVPRPAAAAHAAVLPSWQVIEHLRQAIAVSGSTLDSSAPVLYATSRLLGRLPALQRIPTAQIVSVLHLERHTVSQRDDFLDALRETGFRDLSVDDMIAICNAGVSPRFLRELHAAGFTPLPAQDLIALANAGVNARFLAGLRDAGYGNLGVANMVALSNAGIDPHYLASMAALGYRNVSVTDLIRLSESGVTPDFVARLQKSGVTTGQKLSVDDLIRLSNAGI